MIPERLHAHRHSSEPFVVASHRCVSESARRGAGQCTARRWRGARLWAVGGCLSGKPQNDLHQALLRCKMQPAAGFPRRIWRSPFIDHSSEVWNFGCRFASDEKGEAMRKTLMALAAAAAVALSATAARPRPTRFRRWPGCRGHRRRHRRRRAGRPRLLRPGYYGPGYYGYGGPAYVAGGYYGGCVWQRQRFWDGYGWRVRRVRVCG